MTAAHTAPQHADFPGPNGRGPRRPNIALVGFSTTGKSTVARLLADRLGWSAVDTDALVVCLAGRPIIDIFRREGEAAFRARETAALTGALAGRGKVVATGGGVVTQAVNENLLRARSLIICLTAEPLTILKRLERAAGSEPRPLLKASDPLARIHELLAERRAAYAQADLTIATDDLTPQQVAQEILARLTAADLMPDHVLPPQEAIDDV